MTPTRLTANDGQEALFKNGVRRVPERFSMCRVMPALGGLTCPDRPPGRRLQGAIDLWVPPSSIAMTTSLCRTHPGALAAVALIVLTSALQAQELPRHSLALHAGAEQFDLRGTGTTAGLALRGAYGLNRVVRLELGLSGARPEQVTGLEGAAGTTTLIISELQLQFRRPGRVSPYLGIGGGWARESALGPFPVRNSLTASVSGGLGVALNQQLGLVGELRVRGIGRRFQGSTASWTLGLTHALGG